MLFSMRSKSPPAENTLPPAPWMITQLTVSSPSMSRHTLTSSVCMIESVALYLSGRFMVTRSTLGCGRSNSRRWYLFCQSDIEVPPFPEQPSVRRTRCLGLARQQCLHVLGHLWQHGVGLGLLRNHRL